MQDKGRQQGGRYQHQKCRGGVKTAEVKAEPMQKEMKGEKIRQGKIKEVEDHVLLKGTLRLHID